MEKDRALNLLQNGLLPQVHGAYYEALKMAIADMRKLSYLTDRPCAVCKFNEDGNGCKKWICAFEDDGKENV